MLSYKDYKLLNESLYGITPLGVAKPSVLGGVVGATGASDDIEEGCGGKHMKKKMSAEDLEDVVDDEDVDDEEVMDDEELADLDDDDGGSCGGSDDEEIMMSKKGMKKCSKKKSKKQMKAENSTPEEESWWNSVHNMLGINPTTKGWDGMSVQEDQLIAPPSSDGMVYREPQPGEVGYAPQGRMGSNFEPADSGWKYDG